MVDMCGLFEYLTACMCGLLSKIRIFAPLFK